MLVITLKSTTLISTFFSFLKAYFPNCRLQWDICEAVLKRKGHLKWHTNLYLAKRMNKTILATLATIDLMPNFVNCYANCSQLTKLGILSTI